MKISVDTQVNLEFIFEWKFKNKTTKYISVAKDENDVINFNSQRYKVDKTEIEIISCKTLGELYG